MTDAVMDDARAWQQRPLDDVYPVVFLDAFVLKVKEGGSDVLGMWFQQTEGAKFWMHSVNSCWKNGRERGRFRVKRRFRAAVRPSKQAIARIAPPPTPRAAQNGERRPR